MCGIAGYFRFDNKKVKQSTLYNMGSSIAHRGPDGQGEWYKNNIGFAHRRLAIIDLSNNASQPMATVNKRYTIVYNGEVYNFKEIRDELRILGYEFKTNSDTEVILNAWSHWEQKSLNKFNGMFAFALYDDLKGELHLCRDRYGIKPLYYYLDHKQVIFGSEVKAILAHDDISASPDLAAMLEYFTFQNLFTDKTLFAGIKLLEAGNHMIINQSGKTQKTQWWDFCFKEQTIKIDEEEYIEELSRLFNQAVKRQLVADVSVASYLSGGIDSAAITAVASKELSHLRTFTIGFDLYSASGLELNFDERRLAEHMSYLFGTEHYEMVLKAGDMTRCLDKMAWHIEEPRVGQSYPNYYASQLVSKFDKVVLAGVGGDEIFGGYPWRYYRAAVNNNFDNYIDKYYESWQRLIPNKEIKKVFSPVWNEVNHVWTKDIFSNVFGAKIKSINSPEEYVNHSLYFEAKTFLHGLLVVEDKLSMAHGLETRVPFLDNDLVDFATKIPVNLKLGNLGKVVQLNENEVGAKTERYFKKSKDGKLILRQVLGRYVPDNIAQREKQGFSAPDASWFRGESIEYVKDKLFNNKNNIYQILDKKSIQNLVNEHLDGKQNRRLLIWSLLSIDKWLETFC